MQLKKFKTLSGHQGPVYALCKEKDGIFYSAGSDRKIVHWDPERSEVTTCIETGSAVFSLCYSLEQQVLYAGAQNGDIFLNDKKEVLHSESAVFSILWNNTDSIITGNEKGQLIRWEEGKSKDILSTGAGKIRRIKKDGNNLYFSGTRGLFRLKEDKNIDLINTGHSGSVYDFILFEKDIITASQDGHLHLTRNLELIKKIPAHYGAVYTLEENPSQKILASASRDKSIKLWDRELNFLFKTAAEEGHQRSVNCLLWIDQETLVSAGDEGLIIIWKLHV